MAKKKTDAKATDPCPNCGDTFVKVAQPTQAQRDAAASKDNPIPVPSHLDSAPAAQLAELGDLYRCPTCDYRTRVKAADAAGDPASLNVD